MQVGSQLSIFVSWYSIHSNIDSPKISEFLLQYVHITNKIGVVTKHTEPAVLFVVYISTTSRILGSP